MSVSYKGITGYGFFTSVHETDWTDANDLTVQSTKDRIWELFPESAKKRASNKSYFFGDEFDHDELSSVIQKHFPDLKIIWKGNPYGRDTTYSLFVAIRSTVIEVSEDNNEAVNLRSHAKVKAEALQALSDLAKIFGDTNVKPGWHTWFQIG